MGLPADSRSIAETHYQLGVAQGFHLHFEEAVKSLNDAITVLTTRINNLKKKTESKEETMRKMKEEAGFSNGAGTSGESAKPVSTIAVKKRVHSTEESKSPKKAHVEETKETTK